MRVKLNALPSMCHNGKWLGWGVLVFCDIDGRVF